MLLHYGVRAIILSIVLFASFPANAADPWLVIEGHPGAIGAGKHIVFVSGDDEYRSEEALPQLAKILARLGFKCTVLFPIDKNDGTINPAEKGNIPGLEALKTADLMVLGLRFRDLPDEQMKHIVDYLDAGKPVVGLRTSTHAFKVPPGKTYSKYSFDSNEPEYEKGFGRQVLGESWVSHHGKHGVEGTRGVIAPWQAAQPILRGIREGDIFGTTDVYTVNLPPDAVPIVLGQVTESLQPDSKPVDGKKNDPMMPVAWTRAYGKNGRVFTTTMGASQDLRSEGTRRLIVNGCLWALGLENKIPARTNVDIVGKYEPTPFKMNGFKTGVKPADLAKD